MRARGAVLGRRGDAPEGSPRAEQGEFRQALVLAGDGEVEQVRTALARYRAAGRSAALIEGTEIVRRRLDRMDLREVAA